MEEDDDSAFKKVLNRLAYSTARWLEVRAVLMEEINGNKELIDLIDKKVRENEDKISKLN